MMWCSFTLTGEVAQQSEHQGINLIEGSNAVLHCPQRLLRSANIASDVFNLILTLEVP